MSCHVTSSHVMSRHVMSSRKGNEETRRQIQDKDKDNASEQVRLTLATRGLMSETLLLVMVMVPSPLSDDVKS